MSIQTAHKSQEKVAGTDAGDQMEEPRISDFLKPHRIHLGLCTNSRKRLFEYVAELASSDLEEVSESEVFKVLTQRERLGCTGLGKGIAVPHGRIENLRQPVIALARLNDPIDYDAPDSVPVWLAVGLLVPAEANDTHLKLLSIVAGCFQDQEFVEALKECETPEAVIALFDNH